MKLIVGLGNPGKEYENTRHNIGFNFLNYYLNYRNVNEKWSSKFDGLYINTNIFGEKIIFLKPQTYMNLSGISVKKIVDYFNIDIADVLIISDDLDLSIGNFKLKPNGSSGGHNGLKSIESSLSSSNYKRLKIGISKNNDIDTKDYVLGTISKSDKLLYDELFKQLCFVLDDYLKLDFNELMNKYNRKNR